MLMAARKIQGIGLLLLLLILAMALYPLSLRVASKRSELAKVEREIVRTRDNIRYLETELGARASLRQLERWNAETFAYSAPVAGQYLASERQLATVGVVDPKLASLTVVAPVEAPGASQGTVAGSKLDGMRLAQLALPGTVALRQLRARQAMEVAAELGAREVGRAADGIERQAPTPAAVDRDYSVKARVRQRSQPAGRDLLGAMVRATSERPRP